ncbi:MAG TPA: hypothetical protein V6C57_07545 [Coleofasciculaceae cyanobacterium]
MDKFTPTRYSNPCPICNDTTGRCRQIETRTLCMTYTDGSAPQGYKFLGLTQDNLWGKFILTPDASWSEEQRNEWQEARDRRVAQAAADEAKRRAECMPPEERDRHYRAILAQLTLHPDDRADLLKRGLTDEQIESWGVKSVDQWQPLGKKLPGNLPGLNLDRRSLNAPQAGYLCPIRDAQGLIVACQIRSRQPGEDEPRYVWLSKHPQGATPHTLNGELPLAVHVPEAIAVSSVGMCEGTGAKPFIAAQNRNQVVIGAAGGLFASSAETLRETLQAISAEVIDFYPDAGAIANHHVLTQYQATWRLLQSWGYVVRIGWWDQFSKGDGDIDEIDCAIAWLETDEFWQMATQRALHDCLVLARSLGISPDAPLQPEDVQRSGMVSRLNRMGAIELLQLKRQLEAKRDLCAYRNKVRLLMHSLAIDWQHPLMARWLAAYGGKPENLTLKELKTLIQKLETVRTRLQEAA